MTLLDEAFDEELLEEAATDDAEDEVFGEELLEEAAVDTGNGATPSLAITVGSSPLKI